MTRLPAPSLPRPAAALPRDPRLAGYRPGRVRPPVPRVLAPVTDPTAPPVPPAGLVGAEEAARVLATPARIVRHLARVAPDLLPPVTWSGEEPCFHPADLAMWP